MNDKVISEDEMSRDELLLALEEVQRLIENDDGGSIYCPNYLKWKNLYKNKIFKSHKV